MPQTRTQQRLGVTLADFRRPVGCPAGEFISETVQGPGCHCRIEDTLLTASHDPSSLASFCQGDYRLCPTWQQDWERRAARRLIDQEPDRSRSRDTLLDQDPERVPSFAVPHE